MALGKSDNGRDHASNLFLLLFAVSLPFFTYSHVVAVFFKGLAFVRSKPLVNSPLTSWFIIIVIIITDRFYGSSSVPPTERNGEEPCLNAIECEILGTGGADPSVGQNSPDRWRWARRSAIGWREREGEYTFNTKAQKEPQVGIEVRP